MSATTRLNDGVCRQRLRKLKSLTFADRLPLRQRHQSQAKPAGVDAELIIQGVSNHCYAGYTVPMFYDSMLGKLIVYGSDGSEAVERMHRALEQFVIVGIPTTLPFLQFVMSPASFLAGNVSTRLVEQMIPQMLAQSKIRIDESNLSP